MKSLATLFAVVCLASTAHADGSDQLVVAAKAHYEQGQTLFAAGRYAEARAEFLAGYELSKKPTFLFNAAECARLLGDMRTARDGYSRYLDLDPNGRLAMLAMQRLAELGPSPSATPPEPAPPPSPAPAPAPAPAPVLVTPPPAPAPTVTPPPVATTTTAVAIAPPLSDDQAHTAQLERYVGIGIAGTGVALVFTGAIFGFHSSTLSSQVSGACANGCVWSDVADKDASAHTAAAVQWWMYGIGAAAIVGGGALYLLGRHEQSPVVVAPIPNGAAVSWSGRF